MPVDRHDLQPQSASGDPVTCLPNQPDQLRNAHELLREVKQSAGAESGSELYEFACLLLQLLDVIDGWHDDSDWRLENAQQLSSFIADGLSKVRAAVAGDSAALEPIKDLTREARGNWEEYLELLEDRQTDDAYRGGWNDSGDAAAESADEDLTAPSEEEITALLAELGQVSGVGEPEKEENAEPPRHEPHRAVPSAEPCDEVEIDAELREAFLDDAGRCLTGIEDAIVALEAEPGSKESLQQICRELHTLKGASGSVGLSKLADYLHQVEETLRAACSASGPVPPASTLFDYFDNIRRHVEAIAPAKAADSEQDGCAASAAPHLSDEPHESTVPPVFDEGVDDDESVRVKASQLNRLMDMLAELVMLRNRRGSELTQLKEIHHELIHSASRLRVFSDGCDGDVATGNGKHRDAVGQPLPQLAEVAGDVLESAQRLRDCYQPLAEANSAVSQFIGQLRQELVELRRTPVSALFRRLRRVARDAARVEGREVQLRLVDEDAAIERSLQQRLYEPLLHIVRNAVSHGIEAPEERVGRGKQRTGTVTLRAEAGPELLLIEIQDDGRGLNYDALRRRGQELGLLRSDQVASHEELAQLIFHPGFSTQQNVSQISGRGVGMDVVAATLEKMRGWVEVDSHPGQGTTVRLKFPVPSVIQHAMVFRCGDQLFALPMQTVQAVGDIQGDLRTVHCSELFEIERGYSQSPKPKIVVAGDVGPDSVESQRPQIALEVDEVVGPEEVVVRPLPSLLRHHPLCGGATLSGMGKLVLVLDSRRLTELATLQRCRRAQRTHHAASPPAIAASAPAPRVLVVDDSLSARTALVRSLHRYGIETVEAGDGEEAVELLKNQAFDAVFSDMEMPKLDGLGLLARIKSWGPERSLPTVIISSRIEEEFQRQAAEQGAIDYLGKPLADESLNQALRKIPSLWSAISRDHSPEPSVRKS